MYGSWGRQSKNLNTADINRKKTIKRGEFSIRNDPIANDSASIYMNTFTMEKSKAYLRKDAAFADQPGKPIEPKDIAAEMQDYFKNMNKDENAHEAMLARSKYFQSVTTKPIVSHRPVKLLEHEYPLEEGELLNVCENKSFEIRNYYNYLYEEEIAKAVAKVEERNRLFEEEMKRKKRELEGQEAEGMQQDYHPVVDSVVEKQEKKILDPEHSAYLHPLQTFNVKEKERLNPGKNQGMGSRDSRPGRGYEATRRYGYDSNDSYY